MSDHSPDSLCVSGFGCVLQNCLRFSFSEQRVFSDPLTVDRGASPGSETNPKSAAGLLFQPIRFTEQLSVVCCASAF